MTTASAGSAELDEIARESIGFLTSFERASASQGERRAADWIASRLRAEGCTVSVEEERAHGTYWWPLGLLAGAAGLASLSGRRWLRTLAGAGSAALIADDVSGGGLWFRRAALPRRATWNVVASAGDQSAERTLVFVAHHDAAHWSLLFAPQVPEFFAEHFPRALEKADTTPAVMFPVVGGPILVALGGLTGVRALRRAGAALSLGTAATMIEIGSRSTVDGANDNLSGVAALLGLARTLRERPPQGVRVLLVSTGSEESFMEGMQGFAARHFASLPTETTSFVCLDTVGSPELIMLEGEGMLVMRDYPEDFKALVEGAAGRAGVRLRRGLRFRNATDGLIALKAGYPAVMIGSLNRFKAPSNYHWPTDTAENVCYETVVDAALLCDAVVRTVAEQSAGPDG